MNDQLELQEDLDPEFLLDTRAQEQELAYLQQVENELGLQF